MCAPMPDPTIDTVSLPTRGDIVEARDMRCMPVAVADLDLDLDPGPTAAAPAGRALASVDRRRWERRLASVLLVAFAALLCAWAASLGHGAAGGVTPVRVVVPAQAVPAPAPQPVP